MSFLTRLLISAFVLVCTIQALYWPILMKPGTQLDWWQIGWLARLGSWLGYIPLAVALGTGSQLAAWVSALVWAFLIFWGLGILFRSISGSRHDAQGDGTQPA